MTTAITWFLFLTIRHGPCKDHYAARSTWCTESSTTMSFKTKSQCEKVGQEINKFKDNKANFICVMSDK